MLCQKLNVGIGGIANAPIDTPFRAVGEHAEGAGAAGDVLLEVTLYLPVGGTIASHGLVKVGSVFFGLDDDGGVAGAGVDDVQEAGFVEAVPLLAVLRYAVRCRVAQRVERRLYQQRQGGRFVDQFSPAGNVPHPFAQ